MAQLDGQVATTSMGLRNMTNRNFATVIVTVILILAGACDGDRLNRSTAKSLLAESEAFKKPATETIVLGNDFRNLDFVGMVNWNMTDDLVDLGYLSRDTGSIELREKGQSEEEHWLRDNDRTAVRMIPIAYAELTDVTGIVQEENAIRAEVQFDWRYKLTPIGVDLVDFGDRTKEQFKARYGPDKLHKGVAEFTRYDDGWRLDRIHD
jgi:hypothetical protein